MLFIDYQKTGGGAMPNKRGVFKLRISEEKKNCLVGMKASQVRKRFSKNFGNTVVVYINDRERKDDFVVIPFDDIFFTAELLICPKCHDPIVKTPDMVKDDKSDTFYHKKCK